MVLHFFLECLLHLPGLILRRKRLTWTPKMDGWKMIFSFSSGWFWGSMLILRGVCLCWCSNACSSEFCTQNDMASEKCIWSNHTISLAEWYDSKAKFHRINPGQWRWYRHDLILLVSIFTSCIYRLEFKIYASIRGWSTTKNRPRIAAVLVGGTTPDSTAMARNEEYNLDGQIDHVDFPNGNMVSIKMTFFKCICILIQIVSIYNCKIWNICIIYCTYK